MVRFKQQMLYVNLFDLWLWHWQPRPKDDMLSDNTWALKRLISPCAFNSLLKRTTNKYQCSTLLPLCGGTNCWPVGSTQKGPLIMNRTAFSFCGRFISNYNNNLHLHSFNNHVNHYLLMEFLPWKFPNTSIAVIANYFVDSFHTERVDLIYMALINSHTVFCFFVIIIIISTIHFSGFHFISNHLRALPRCYFSLHIIIFIPYWHFIAILLTWLAVGLVASVNCVYFTQHWINLILFDVTIKQKWHRCLIWPSGSI